jgi:hypothetical protein
MARFGDYEAVEGKLASDDARAAYVTKTVGGSDLGPNAWGGTSSTKPHRAPVASFWSYDEAVRWARDCAARDASADAPSVTATEAPMSGGLGLQLPHDVAHPSRLVFRLRVFVDDMSMYALAAFTPNDIALLINLKGSVDRLMDEMGGIFEGLSLWLCFSQVWVDDCEYELGGDEVERVSPDTVFPAEQGPEDPEDGPHAVRTEYDLVLLDRHGVTFRADIKHTDTTISTATIPWHELLGE